MSAVSISAAKPAQSVAGNDISFRAEGAGTGADAIGALLTLAVLMAAVIMALWFAKKKGWLDRWTGGTVSAQAATRALRIERTLRLSPRTVVYRIADGEESYLVVESSANTQLTLLSVESGSADGD